MRTATTKYLTGAQTARMERILATTKRMLSEVGPESMTIRDLAAASNVAPATLYKRFGGKDALIAVAVIDHYEQTILKYFEDDRGSGSPVDRVVYGLELFDQEIQHSPALAQALMSAHFRIGNDRLMSDKLYGIAYKTWLSLLEEMRQRKSLRDWVSLPHLCAEMCDREFAVVMKWCQGTIPHDFLRNALVFGMLSVLLGASKGQQASQIEQMLQKILKQAPLPILSSEARAAPRKPAAKPRK